MSNPEHMAILQQGVEAWNSWRDNNAGIMPDLRDADFWEENLVGANFKDTNLTNSNLEEARLWGTELEGANLTGATLDRADLSNTYLSDTKLQDVTLRGSDLSCTFLSGNSLRGIDLEGADLSSASLWRTDLSHANLKGVDLRNAYLAEAILTDSNLSNANLVSANLERADMKRSILNEADLCWANLQAADLRGAQMWGTNFRGANLGWAKLQGSTLEHASLIETRLYGADLTDCRVFGISAWGIKTDRETRQDRLLIARDNVKITVSDLEIAQFLYLIINNQKLGHFINVMRTKSVLILGSFMNPYSIDLIDSLGRDLSARGFVPIVFNFDTSESAFPIQTVQTLALLSNFVIVDLSDRSGQYRELGIVPTTYVPFILIAKHGTKVSGMLCEPQPWLAEDYFPYPVDQHEAKEYFPRLVEEHILPRAVVMNNDLRKLRKRGCIPEAQEK